MEKNKKKAILLAMFGGLLGLHKFYLREIGGGISYIVFFYLMFGWFRIPITFVLGILDAVKLMKMPQETFDAKYNKNIRGFRDRQAQYPRTAETSRTAHEPRTQRRRQENHQPQPPSKRQRSNPFKTSAFKKYKDFDLEGAIEDYKQALEISPTDREIHFKMAGIYSLLEKKDLSYNHIELAINHGHRDTNKIIDLDDFAFLRIQKDFEEFKNNGFKRIAGTPKTDSNSELILDDLLLARLNKLKELRDRGLLSEKEFLYEKEKITNK